MASFSQNSGRMNRRRFMQAAATTASAALFADVLAACNVPGTVSSSSSSSSTVTINYWDWFVSQAPWVDGEIKLFQQAHPNIKIKKTTQGNNTYANLFSLAAKGNNPPDVFMIAQTPSLNDQVAQNWLLPVDKWANDSWKSKFPAGTFHEGNNVFNGKTYSAPLGGSAPWVQLYVNHQVFKDAGLTNSDGSPMIPKTWDDVTHAAEQIMKKSNGQVYGLGFGNGSFNLIPWWLELFIRGAGVPGGAYGMDNRVGKYTYGTDRNYQDWISLFLDWKKRGYFYPNSMSITDEVSRAYFERGKFGMTVGGVWNQPEWTDHKFTEYSLNTLISPQEQPKGYFYKSPGGTFIAISSKTKHPDEAWAWFDWIYSPDAGKRWVALGEDLSAFQQNNDPALVKFKPFAQYVATSSDKYILNGPDVSVRNPQTSQVIVDAVKPDIGDVLAGLYTGQLKDVHAALSDLQGRMQKAQDDGVSKAKAKGVNVSADDYTFSDWDITQPYTTKPKA